MTIEEKILDYQLNHDVFANAKYPSAEGIAKCAIEKGFSTLSSKQVAVLKPYLSVTCSGVTNPGEHHNGCLVELEGNNLLDAYEQSDDTECLICDNCYNEKADYAHDWDKNYQD
jgi:hypothetical protein